MSYQPPGPYPGIPQYPGGVGLPPKPPLPQTVLRAHYCMLAGAALSIVSVVTAFSQRAEIRSVLRQGLPDTDPSTVNSLVTAAMAAAVVAGLVEVGLWLWMAFANKAGKNYARIVSSVFFGLYAVDALSGTVTFAASSGSGTSSTFAASDTALAQVVTWLTFAVGLTAIVLLWVKASGAYFKPQQFLSGPYGYPGYQPGQAAPAQPPHQYPYMPPQPPRQGQQAQPPQGGGTPPDFGA